MSISKNFLKNLLLVQNIFVTFPKKEDILIINDQFQKTILLENIIINYSMVN